MAVAKMTGELEKVKDAALSLQRKHLRKVESEVRVWGCEFRVYAEMQGLLSATSSARIPTLGFRIRESGLRD